MSTPHEHVFTTTDTTFATDVLQSPTPVLVQATQIGLVSKSQLTKVIDAAL